MSRWVCVTLRPHAASCHSGHRQEWSGRLFCPSVGSQGVSGHVRTGMWVEGAWRRHRTSEPFRVHMPSAVLRALHRGMLEFRKHCRGPPREAANPGKVVSDLQTVDAGVLGTGSPGCPHITAQICLLIPKGKGPSTTQS